MPELSSTKHLTANQYDFKNNEIIWERESENILTSHETAILKSNENNFNN